jgi:hypothetical protein
MLLAQGLGEYGALSGGLSGGGGGFSRLADVFDNLEDAIRDAGPTAWVAIFFGVFVLWFVFFRSR